MDEQEGSERRQDQADVRPRPRLWTVQGTAIFTNSMETERIADLVRDFGARVEPLYGKEAIDALLAERKKLLQISVAAELALGLLWMADESQRYGRVRAAYRVLSSTFGGPESEGVGAAIGRAIDMANQAQDLLGGALGCVEKHEERDPWRKVVEKMVAAERERIAKKFTGVFACCCDAEYTGGDIAKSIRNV